LDNIIIYKHKTYWKNTNILDNNKDVMKLFFMDCKEVKLLVMHPK